MNKSLIIIADYCIDALATAEVILAVQRHTKVPFPVVPVAARPFNTIHTGFLLDQLERSMSPMQARQNVFFLNTDPRTHQDRGIVDAEGAPLIAAFLRSGAVAIGPNAGSTFSFLRDRPACLHASKGEITGY